MNATTGQAETRRTNRAGDGPLTPCGIGREDLCLAAEGLHAAAATLRTCAPTCEGSNERARRYDEIARTLSSARDGTLHVELSGAWRGHDYGRRRSPAASTEGMPTDQGDHGMRRESPTEAYLKGHADGMRLRATTEAPSAAALGAQLPATLALAEACDNAEVVLSAIAGALEDPDAGASVSIVRTARDAATRLRQAARSLAEACPLARQERDQVVQVLEAIVSKASTPTPPKAPPAIRPAPRPLVRLGPGGEFTRDINA